MNDQARTFSQSRRGNALVATAVLGFCCICWGFSFPAMQMAADRVDRLSDQLHAMPSERAYLAVRATFNGWRFSLAAIAYGLLSLVFGRVGRASSESQPRRPISREEWLGGGIVGLCFGVGIFMQLLGLRYTLPSVSGFLTSLAVVFAPLGQALILKRAVGIRTLIAVVVALAGIAILSIPNHKATTNQTLAASPPFMLLGQLLTAGASMLFTGQILAVDHFGARADPKRLTVILLCVTASVNLAGGLLLGGAGLYRGDVLREIISDRTLMWTMPALVVFSSVVALHLMNTWQPSVSAATASVIYCLEPAFATLFAVAFGVERLTLITIWGGIVIMLAVLIVATEPR